MQLNWRVSELVNLVAYAEEESEGRVFGLVEPVVTVTDGLKEICTALDVSDMERRLEKLVRGAVGRCRRYESSFRALWPELEATLLDAKAFLDGDFRLVVNEMLSMSVGTRAEPPLEVDAWLVARARNNMSRGSPCIICVRQPSRAALAEVCLHELLHVVMGHRDQSVTPFDHTLVFVLSGFLAQRHYGADDYLPLVRRVPAIRQAVTRVANSADGPALQDSLTEAGVPRSLLAEWNLIPS